MIRRSGIILLFVLTKARSRRMANSWLQKHAHSSISSPIFFFLIIFFWSFGFNVIRSSTTAFITFNQKLANLSTIQFSFNLCSTAFTSYSNLDWLQFVGFGWNNCFFNNFGHNWNENKEWMTIYIIFSISYFEELFVLFISSFVWKQYLRREKKRERESKEERNKNKIKASA